jgi:hypothetical protein
VNIAFEKDDYRRLQELFMQMRFGSQSRNDPSAFIAAWPSVHPSFHEGHQEDPLEFFLEVVGSLPTVMTSLFDGQTITELKQLNGRLIESIRESFLSLDLDIMHSHDIGESVHFATENEMLHGDNRHLLDFQAVHCGFPGDPESDPGRPLQQALYTWRHEICRQSGTLNRQ